MGTRGGGGAGDEGRVVRAGVCAGGEEDGGGEGDEDEGWGGGGGTGLGGRVDLVPQDRMAQGRQVHPQLVRPAASVRATFEWFGRQNLSYSTFPAAGASCERAS